VDLNALVRKYSKEGPRYTSYPTAPFWTESCGENVYREKLRSQSCAPLALYCHIPFCESLCYYCGCNIQIVKDKKRSLSYLEALLREIETVAGLLGEERELSQISWGGGTPTFLSTKELEKLYGALASHFKILPDAEVSIEIDPRVTSVEQLEMLRELGFNRVSLGVQDFNPKVQEAVNRVQPREMTAEMLERCRALGFMGINFDLIYGLPYQTLSTFEETVQALISIKPDRVALYHYAHLPSLRSHQKILEDLESPSPETRVRIFTMAYQTLIEHGYRPIGMDHFALETDELYRSLNRGTLYRNFMGYTVKKSPSLLGIGASSIGELEGSYFQNVREARAYEERISKTGLATFRGCRLTEDDRKRKWVIQRLMCRFEVSHSEFEKEFESSFREYFSEDLILLEPFYQEGLVEARNGGIVVTSLGRLFIRNIAMVFDTYLKLPRESIYSKTV